jgi:hypothetical protein
MKKLFLFYPLLLFSFTIEVIAQEGNQGVYLSAKDFTNGKISFVNDQSKKYKLHWNEPLNSSTTKVIIGDSVIKLNKDSIFGYRDKKNVCYRFYNKVAYKIINPTEEILIYSKTSSEGVPKNNHTVTKYYFSPNASSQIYPLTKWQLKTVLINDVAFNKLLDVYFHNDDDLFAFDNNNKVYYLNYVYKLSKQKTSN